MSRLKENMLEESQWIHKARQGDQKAIKHLFDGHVVSLYRFLKQFSRNQDEVEDWVQRAFIKAFENLASFDGRARFSSWLFRIALNEMRNDRRRDGIVSFLRIQEDGQIHKNTADDFEWKETMKQLLASLDEAKRAVFILYEIEGYSHAEIASMIGIRESTSRSLLTRAKQWLREQWMKEGVGTR